MKDVQNVSLSSIVADFKLPSIQNVESNQIVLSHYRKIFEQTILFEMKFLLIKAHLEWKWWLWSFCFNQNWFEMKIMTLKHFNKTDLKWNDDDCATFLFRKRLRSRGRESPARKSFTKLQNDFSLFNLKTRAYSDQTVQNVDSFKDRFSLKKLRRSLVGFFFCK